MFSYENKPYQYSQEILANDKQKNFFNKLPKINNQETKNFIVQNRMIDFIYYPVLIKKNPDKEKYYHREYKVKTDINSFVTTKACIGIEEHSYRNLSIYNHIKDTFSGNIMIYSGKLGIVPYFLSKKDNVDSIVIIETYQELIDLQKKYFEVLPKKYKNKISFQLIDNISHYSPSDEFDYMYINFFMDDIQNEPSYVNKNKLIEQLKNNFSKYCKNECMITHMDFLLDVEFQKLTWRR